MAPPRDVVLVAAVMMMTMIGTISTLVPVVPQVARSDDSSWQAERFAVIGSFQPLLNPSVLENDLSNEAQDLDNDGIWTLSDIHLPAGAYDFAFVNLESNYVYGLNGTGGVLGSSSSSSVVKRHFTVEEPGSTVEYFFDIRDLVFDVSVNVIPTVCGDFMTDAGYFSNEAVDDGNWNPDNMLGWLKHIDGGDGHVHRTYLRVPVGQWKFKICFRGTPMATNSVGFAGTQFPITLNIDDAGVTGADVVFMYDSLTQAVSTSVGGTIPNLLSHLTARETTQGDHALTPYLPSEMGSWMNQNISFWGAFGRFSTTPERGGGGLHNVAADDDGDGIAQISYDFLEPGPYGGFVVMMWDDVAMEWYDRLGQETVFSWGSMKYTFFPIPMPPLGETTTISFFFDWRDRMVSTTSMPMPVLCGDFMAEAGYYGPSLGEVAANWNPKNLLGWMKAYDDNTLYQVFLHVPHGQWKYKVCFEGESLEASLGVGGSQFPFTLDVASPSGADIVFLYDSSTSTVADSLNLVSPLFLSSPTLTSPLGDRSLTAYLPSEMGSWMNQNISFWGAFGRFSTTPERGGGGLHNVAADDDGDGIAQISYDFLEPGPYGGFIVMMWDDVAMEWYDRLGQETVFSWGSMKYTFFPIPMPPLGETTTISFFFDWRDRMVSTTSMPMPVLCGDFMAEAGYFSPSVGQESANWNSNNLMGWMKDNADDSVFMVFLHVPQGQWQYKIGFYGESLATNSLGFAGSVFPVGLSITAAAGLDVTFMYEPTTGGMYDSVNGPIASLTRPPLYKSVLGGGHALVPYDMASMAGSWSGTSFAFRGDYGPSLDPPQPAFDAASSTAVDTDGDGIIQLELSLSAGIYAFIVEDSASGEVYNAMGEAVGLDLAAARDRRSFEVKGEGGEQVTLFLDLRDHVYEASTNVMPVLCSDFMAAAGYYGPSVGGGAANWNPDNLIGWMKNYNGRGSNYHTFLHVPEGQWHYKVCFRGQPISSGHGFGGDSSIPVPLTIPTGGADVAFVYDTGWNLIADSINGLPILSCSVDCGAHGTCVAEQCLCDAGYVGMWCDFETHFNPVFWKNITVTTVEGTLAYADGPPVDVPVSGPVTCDDLVLGGDGVLTCNVVLEVASPETVFTTVNGTVLTERLEDGSEVPVYVVQPVTETIQVVDEGRDCYDISDCAFHCEPGWTGTYCSLPDHCVERDATGEACVGGCEHGWAGEHCMQRLPMAGGAGFAMDMGVRNHPWKLPPDGSPARPTFGGGLMATIYRYGASWKCKEPGATPFTHIKTMETWVFMFPYSDDHPEAVMPLFSVEVIEWGLLFVAPGAFRQVLAVGPPGMGPQTDTNTGVNLGNGIFPVYHGEPGAWVHVAMVLTPDEDDGMFEFTSYVNGEMQFTSPSRIDTTFGWWDGHSNPKLLSLGNFFLYESVERSHHQQFVRPYFDEFRLWTKPMGSRDIKERMHRMLTSDELAWPDENNFPDCFFYVPFAANNFKIQGDGEAELGTYFLPIISTADGLLTKFVLSRSGSSADFFDDQEVDISAVLPSSAPVSGSEHIVVGDAGTPVTFSFPAMVAVETASDAVGYHPLKPLDSSEGETTGLVRVTSIVWQDRLSLMEGEEVVTGQYNGTLTLDGGATTVEVGDTFASTSNLTVSMDAGEWSDFSIIWVNSGKERMMFVVRVGYTITTTPGGLTSPVGVVAVQVRPPSTPVVGTSSKALRCHGAGPLGSKLSDFVHWRQWASADLTVNFTDGGSEAAEGVTIEFWVLGENLEEGGDDTRLRNRFIHSLGGFGDTSPLSHHFDERGLEDAYGGTIGSFGESKYLGPLHSWTHMAVHVYPGEDSIPTVFMNGEVVMEKERPLLASSVHRGYFLCGRPAFQEEADGMGDMTSFHRGLEGAVDDVRIWRGKRSQQQVRDWMFHRMDVSTMSTSEQAALMAYWDFEDDGVEDGKVLDRSGNGHDLVLGGCDIPIDVESPPACEGSVGGVAPAPHVPSTYYPIPQSPVANGASATVNVDMGETPSFTLAGYDPEVFRCPVSPATQCRDPDETRLPRFVFSDGVPSSTGVGGLTLWVGNEEGEDGGGGDGRIMIEDPSIWSSSNTDLIHVVPSISTAGGRPFASLSYRVLNPINGLLSPVMEVHVNIQCAAGHYLNAAAKKCHVCPVGTYLQSPSYETTCCELAAPDSGCFQCEDEGMIMVPNSNSSLAGTVVCMWAPCGEYETQLMLDNGRQACVPSFDLPPPSRDAMMAASVVVMLVVLGVSVSVVRYRRTRVMVNSSFQFLLLMLLGLLLMTGAVMVELQPATPGRCFSKTLLFHVGFSLMFSSATARAWKLHRIFNAKKLKRVTVPASELLMLIGFFVGGDMVLILVWGAVAPFEVPDVMQKECESDLLDVFFGLLLAGKVGLMTFGCWVAYMVRSVPSTFIENSGVAVTLNNVALMAFVILLVTNAMREQLNEGGALKLLQAIGGLVGVITPIAFIFLPKLKLARINTGGTGMIKGSTRSALTSSSDGAGGRGRGQQSSRDRKSSSFRLSDAEQIMELKASVDANDVALVKKRDDLVKLQKEIRGLTSEIQSAQNEMDYLSSGRRDSTIMSSVAPST